MNDVLCLGSMIDRTFSHTVNRLRSESLRVIVLDLVDVLVGGRIDVDWADQSFSIFCKGKSWCIRDFSAAYVRAYDISLGALDEITRDKCASEFIRLTTALRASDHQRVIGRSLDLSNLSKVFHSIQLAPIANYFDIHTPESIVTNNPSAAMEFIVKHDRMVICKGASAFKTTARLLRESDILRLDLIKRCATLLQQYIHGPDVRVHLVAEESFAEAIFSSDVDYRFSNNKSHEVVQIPDFVQRFCAQLGVELECPFLGIDFKISTATGQWYFLEANSMPAYQGYDKRAGGVISLALANYLANKSKN